jgi:hypothetical protein
MRTIGKNRLLMAEKSGKMDIVTFEGPGLHSAVVTTIKEKLESTLGVTATRHGLDRRRTVEITGAIQS